jgi:hypothetical protein
MFKKVVGSSPTDYRMMNWTVISRSFSLRQMIKPLEPDNSLLFQQFP